MIELEQGLAIVQKGITTVTRILEGEPDPAIDPHEHESLHKPPHDYSGQLYDRYRIAVEDYDKKMVLPFSGEMHSEYMLRELVKQWGNHKTMVKWLSRAFYYIDCHYAPWCRLPTLMEVAHTCFCKLINQEREGEQIDRQLLRNICDFSIEIGMGDMTKYRKDFEGFMLEDTASYYSRNASCWIQDYSCPTYMLECEECLRKERERVSHYLHSSTEPKLLETVENSLLVVHANQLLENELSGCRALLRDNKIDDLSRMFRLYHNISKGLELAVDYFKQQVTAEGNILIEEAEGTAATYQVSQAASTGDVDKQVFISKLMELHDKYMLYVTKCFQNHVFFRKALKEAFDIFCNATVAGSSFAELLAVFCDHILKEGRSMKPSLNDEAVEALFDNVVTLVFYIANKDCFRDYCWMKLGRRLLSDHSCIDDDHERSLLTKLRQAFGALQVSNMEHMIADMTVAREVAASFKEHLATDINARLGIDFTANVLSCGFWPNYKLSEVILPNEMVRCLEVFEDYYKKKTSTSRRLTWVHSRGTVHITGHFDERPIELVVNTNQAAVIFLFNNTERLSYSEILEQVNLSHEDLVKVLHSLSCGKYKILRKEPEARSISQEDVFEFNSKFKSRKRKIKVSLPLRDGDWKNFGENLRMQRQFITSAAIMRIMKSRKVLGYMELVSECTELLSQSFKAETSSLKKEIEELINSDYLERDQRDPLLLKYIA